MIKDEFKMIMENTTSKKLVDLDEEKFDLFQKIYEYDDRVPSNALHLIAGSELLLNIPREMSFTSIPFFMLLYCMEGALSMDIENKTLSVAAGQFIALPPFSACSTRINVVPCFLRFWFVGGDVSIFEVSLENASPVQPSLHGHSPLTLEGLSAFPTHISRYQALDLHLYLSNVFTSYCKTSPSLTAMESIRPKKIPAYLDAMHHAIKLHSEDPHTLQHFEDRFGISRYKLCREYRSVYGVSPICDLNLTRIEHAKKLLSETSLSVQEIGYRTGFFDINNFIRVFKKCTNMTPGKFRQAMPSHLS